MKLNLRILYERLSSKYNVRCFGKKRHEFNLERPVLFETGCEFEPNRPYIAYAHDLPETIRQKNATIICVGGPICPDWLSGYMDILIVDGECSVAGIFNEIQHIFDLFDLWDNALMEILHNDNPDMLRLIELGVGMIQNPFRFMSNDFQFLFSAEIIPQDGKEPIVRVSDTPYPIREEEAGLIKDKFKAEHLIKETYTTDSFAPNIRLCCSHTYFLDQYMGTASFEERNKLFRKGDLLLIHHFFAYFHKAYRKYIRNIEKSQYSSSAIIQSLIKHIPLNSYQSSILTLKENEQWLCFSIVRDNKKQALPLDNMSAIINITSQGLAYSTKLGNVIVGLLRVKKTDGHSDTVVLRLKKILRQMDYFGGVSSAVNNLKDIDIYLKQAAFAAEMHFWEKSEEPLSFFDDHILDYMLQSCIGQLKAEHLCSEGFRRLREYDKKHSASLLETLETYLLCESNGAQTAKALFIHRSSLQKRLEKITEIIGNIDAPDDKLYYRLYFRLLSTRGYPLGPSQPTKEPVFAP